MKPVLFLIGAILAMPTLGYAQEAVLTGTVTDSTGAAGCRGTHCQGTADPAAISWRSS